MIIRIMGRSGVVLGVAVLLAACSSGGTNVPKLVNECTWNRSSCMHEGRYEPGEREYAEQEARDLNRASSARLRRGR